ncbi:hypothetical protein CMUST_14125 [Corynebacterium mustelae]|uniref:DIP1984 family protein n=1 Tax=Corynebacterium mustelae TaxID=571915 RepID=A0A0G3H5N3_9CORY|nr:DIP1984 family protein [Corynebacterium mustelae]AKK07118.1 hypothetical protein CMUST_14125 [Corynebacterium mustelae]
MKLAEALYERADLQRRLSMLSVRIKELAQVQEGDTPPEDPEKLLLEYGKLNRRLEALVAKINKVNATSLFDKSRTITDILALRDRLKRDFDLYNELADAAARQTVRWTRSEVKLEATVSVEKLREKANEIAKELRAVDVRVQELNWQIECD